MIVRRDNGVVVEILVGIGLAVVIHIPQPCDLVAAQHKNGVVDDFQTERLKQARGEPAPGQFLQRIIDAGNDVNVAVKRANRRATVRKEIESTEEGADIPWIRIRLGEGIDNVRLVARAAHTPSHCRFGKVRRAALGEAPQIGQSAPAHGHKPGRLSVT